MTTSDHSHAQVNAFPSARGERDSRDNAVGLLEPRPSLVFDGLDEPAFDRQPWLDSGGASLVDNPLLRGLLMELPPKSAPPSPEWMNRWFEAARAVLDLVYDRR